MEVHNKEVDIVLLVNQRKNNVKENRLKQESATYKNVQVSFAIRKYRVSVAAMDLFGPKEKAMSQR